MLLVLQAIGHKITLFYIGTLAFLRESRHTMDPHQMVAQLPPLYKGEQILSHYRSSLFLFQDSFFRHYRPLFDRTAEDMKGQRERGMTSGGHMKYLNLKSRENMALYSGS